MSTTPPVGPEQWWGTEELDAVYDRARRMFGEDPDASEHLLNQALARLDDAARHGSAQAHVRDDVHVDHWRAQLLYARSAQRHYRNDPKALADLQLAADLVDPEHSPLLAAFVLNGRAIWEGFEGRVEDQIATLTLALETIDRVDEDRAVGVRVAVRINLAEILADLGEMDRALGVLTEALPDTRTLGDPEQVEHVWSTAVTVAGMWLMRPDGVELVPAERREQLSAQVQEWAEQATAAAEAAQARDPAVSNRRHALYAAARAAHVRGDLPTARRLADEALEAGRERGEPDHVVRCRVLAGEVAAAQGRFTEARAHLRAGVELTGVLTPTLQLSAWYLLAGCEEALGDERAAMAALQEYVGRSRASRDVRLRNTASLAAVTLLRERAEAERDQARAQGQAARRLARQDALTGIGNRLAFEDALAELSGSGTSVALGLLDLDHFKVVNDVHGHVVGDEVLRVVARAMHDALAGVDTRARLFRIGGEEFAVLLGGEGDDPVGEAVKVLEQVRRTVARLRPDIGGPVVRVTVSAGVAVGAVEDGRAGADRALLSHADQNLYRAKRRGRDLVVAD